MLGAGIRLGEALVGREPAPRRDPGADRRLATRLGALEDRLVHLESQSQASAAEELAGSESVVERQAAEVAEMRSHVAADEGKFEALAENSKHLREELQSWLEHQVNARMADLESKFRVESERSNKQLLDAFIENVQTRVMHRIAKLEEEVAGQSSAMTELRELSLRTEQSMQKLLGGLDRLIVAQQTPATDKPEQAVAGNGTPETGVATDESQEAAAAEKSPPTVQLLPKSRRWSIFG